jgi:hypothetical protein
VLYIRDAFRKISAANLFFSAQRERSFSLAASGVGWLDRRHLAFQFALFRARLAILDLLLGSRLLGPVAICAAHPIIGLERHGV